MTRIRDVRLRQIYDSRGHETVEARVLTDDGGVGVAGAPSGASTGTHEVRAFPTSGVSGALTIFAAKIRPELVGREIADQAEVDRVLHELDGSSDFSIIGGNTATALSVAVALARADEANQPLATFLARPGTSRSRFPAIVGNCLNGGRHAIGGPDIQEFLAFAPEARPSDAIRVALAVHVAVGEELHRRNPKQALGRGDEGGWVAAVSNTDALEILSHACAAVRDELHLAVYPGVDLAASEFYREGRYRYREQTLDTEGQLGFLTKLVERYDIRYVEDPFEQESFEAFAELTRAVGSRTLVVGDDLYATSVSRLARGVEQSATNAVLIKVNQAGTITDTLATVDFARAHRIAPVTSHRSGEVPEGWLAHLAVAFCSVGFKCGLLGGERVAKLNELLRLAAATEKEIE